MAKGSKRERVKKRIHESEESDEEYKATEDEECDESDENYSLDGDESEEILADFGKSKSVVRSRNTRRTSSSRKRNGIKPRKMRRVSYKEDVDVDEEDDDDYDVEVEVEEEDVYEVYDVDDEDDKEFMSMGRKRKANHIKKPREKERVSYTEFDDEEEEDNAEFVSSNSNGNQRKKPREKKKVIYSDEDEEEDDDEEEEDIAEFVSSSRNRNQRNKPHEKEKLIYSDEDEDEDEDEEEDDDDDEDDDDEFMYLGRTANEKKRLREKRKISYTEDDEEDEEEFISSSKKVNQLKEPREIKKKISYKEDNVEDEDEKDTEFKLSESDFDDDEDETPPMKKNDKVSKSHPPKKSKRSKKSRKRKQRNQKLTSSKQASVKNKSHKISKRRKQRVIKVNSDSDFDSYASSDHDYTISEEEREQMREARVYCTSLRAKLRGKQKEEELQRNYPLRKGKEKVEEDIQDTKKEEIGKQVCGICLSEEGKRTVRGVLNCCNHYFCFSCIMEWSKVESRCPLCKQRFTTITKTAKSDTVFGLRTLVIPVPECDQVYQPSEEELRGYLDPYESVICTECHNGGDDSLMLLCDICDSPAHTFCVGLGREVPEGNWYCEGCRPTIISDRRLSTNNNNNNNPSVSDLPSPISSGFDLNELYVPDTPLPQQQPQFADVAVAGTVATTLRDRRRIHRHIHHRFLNNNRSLASSSTSPSSSSGIRLFGSQLQIPNADVALQADNSGSRLGYDATLSPYACREAIGPSRTSQGGFRTPY